MLLVGTLGAVLFWNFLTTGAQVERPLTLQRVFVTIDSPLPEQGITIIQVETLGGSRRLAGRATLASSSGRFPPQLRVAIYDRKAGQTTSQLVTPFTGGGDPLLGTVASLNWDINGKFSGDLEFHVKLP
jgi:hypothetical protein